MARESGLWGWLSCARRSYGDALHIHRVENFLEAGTPDVEGYLELPDCRGQFWIELKSEERPARSSTPIRFKLKKREAQIEFMRKRWEMGANAFFLLQVGSGYDRSLFLAPGDLGPALRDGLTESDLAIHCCNTGFFPKPRLKIPTFQEDILKRVISCRSFPSLITR